MQQRNREKHFILILFYCYFAPSYSVFYFPASFPSTSDWKKRDGSKCIVSLVQRLLRNIVQAEDDLLKIETQPNIIKTAQNTPRFSIFLRAITNIAGCQEKFASDAISRSFLTASSKAIFVAVVSENFFFLRSSCVWQAASKAGRQHRLPHNDTHPHKIIKSAHFPRIGAFSPLRHRMQLEQMIEKVLCIENNNMAFVAALPLQAICCVSKRAFFIIILYTPAFAPLSVLMLFFFCLCFCLAVIHIFVRCFLQPPKSCFILPTILLIAGKIKTATEVSCVLWHKT